jgi:hypothetical protein
MSAFAFILAVVIASNPATASDDPATACRRDALELAGAWTNDGFRLRDSYWSGTLAPDRPSLVRVNLLLGNRYWFTAAAASGDISVTVYGDTGMPVPFETHRDGARAAARVEPSSSGTYLVRVARTQGSPAPFCLVYSYK